MFRRSGPLGAALALVVTAAFMCLLFAPAKDEENLRLVLDWRPEIEPLLVLGLLAMLALAGRRLPAGVRWLLATLLFGAALLQFADAAMLGVLDRELNLYLDPQHVPALLALFYDAAGAWRGGLAILAATVAGLGIIAALAGLIAAAERALARPPHAWFCLAVVAAAAVLGPLRLADGETLLGTHTTPTLAAQAVRLYRSWAAMHGYDRSYGAALAAPQPPAGPLPGLKQRDVIIVFFESYGTAVLDDPRYAAAIDPALGEFAATVAKAGYRLRSSRIVSPTFGGGSWLAHGTIDAGVKLDPLLARLVATTKRMALPGYMAAAGYRTVEVMPGLKTPAPESSFWGFEHSYYARNLGYDGPPFGWFEIPDQYTLARFDAAEGAKERKPLFAQIVLVSSHTPFAPVPPYVADWRDADRYRGIRQPEWDRIYAPPDWSHLDRSYLASIVYDLKTLGNWLARRDRDALVIILGDHQPPGFIAGDRQPWTVPIHVLSRDPELLRPFAAAGYVEGAIPPRSGAFKGMESFLGDFLAAFSHAPTRVAAARRDVPEHVSD